MQFLYLDWLIIPEFYLHLHFETGLFTLKNLLYMKKALLILAMLLVAVASAWADQVNYLDLNGQTQTVEASPITSGTETLATGWYNIPGNISTDKRLRVADGTVTCENDWAYTNDTVTLTVTPDEGYSLESLTIETVDGSEPSGAPLLAPRKAAVDVTPGDEPGTYTFTMPAAPVTVNAVFSEPVATGVENLNTYNVNRSVRYYDLNGRYMGTSLDKAHKGIYVTGDGRKIVK